MTWKMWRKSSYADLLAEEINSKIGNLVQVTTNGNPYCYYITGGSAQEEYWGYAASIQEEYTGSSQEILGSQLPSYDDEDIIHANHNYSLLTCWAPGECVFPKSKILNDINGKITLAKDIKENDEIAYYNIEKDTIEIGKVSKVYIHKKATDFVKYTFEDESYIEVTDYHPIYTKEGWKSYTNRKGYEKPKVNDEVKTPKGWKKLIKIEEFKGIEDCYDFVIIKEDGSVINNYFANETLVQGSY